MSPAHNTATLPSKTNRSKVTNRTALFLDGQIDARTSRARRYRDLTNLIIADLGGFEKITELQHQLAKSSAAMAVLCEVACGEIVSGQQIDLDDYLRLVGALRRHLVALGLKPSATKGHPSLAEYLATHAAAKAAKPSTRHRLPGDGENC